MRFDRPGVVVKRHRLRAAVLALVATLLAGGCQTIGPSNMQRDRMDYGSAIADSWKEQTLLNITKLRYFDTPIFLDISSVVSSYSLQTELSLGARIFPRSRTDTFRELGATGTYIDRPTISYTPVTGKKYVDALLRPIPPQAIFAMIQAGHQADFILRGTVRTINGVHNISSSPGRARKEDLWFWIDDRDIYSKRAFTFLMMFSSIAETGIAPQAPIITIPAN